MFFNSMKRTKAVEPYFDRKRYNIKEFGNVIFIEKYKLHYNLDEVKCENGVLIVRGWLYSDSYNIQRMGIFVGNSEGITELQIPWGLRRLDVYSAKKSEYSQSSGWEILIKYSEETFVRGYIYCVIEDEIVPLEMRDFISNEVDDKKTLFEEVENELQRYLTIDSNLVEQSCETAIKRIKRTVGLKKYSLYFNHNLGGGASSYLSRVLEEEKNSLVVSYDMYCKKYRLSIMNYGNEEVSYQFNCWENLCKRLKKIRISQIVVNELATYPDVYGVLRDINEKLCHWGIKLRFMLHDYFCICPHFDLIGSQGVYCRMPEQNVCCNCLEDKENIMIDEWRRNWRNFLMKCDEVRCFSQASKELLESVYGTELKTNLVPHSMRYFDEIAKKKIIHHVHENDEKLHVGVLGVLTEAKGLHIIEDMLEKIDSEDLPIDITLIGNAGVEIKSDRFMKTGDYDISQLPTLAEKAQIDVFLIPSVWPETFSYTTGEVMAMGYPIVVFDMGAPAERVRKYEKGYVVKEVSADAVCEMLLNDVIKVMK